MTAVGGRTGDRVYVGPGATRALAVLLLLVGALAAVGGVAYAINGATQAPGSVTVPVTVMAEGAAVTDAPVDVRVDGVGLPGGARLQAEQGDLALVLTTGAPRWVGLLARGDVALIGLASGACALLLAPVLTSLAAGDPFRRGNAARVGATAATILGAGTVAPLLPQVAGLAVLARLGLDAPGSPFVLGLSFPVAPLGVAALVFVVAEAFRRGAQLADDTAGLV